MDVKMIGRRGQLMLWVIIAIVLVAAMALFFLVERDPSVITGPDVNPGGFIEKCARESVIEGVDILLPRGGFISKQFGKMNNNVNVTYLCYNRGNYEPCISQHPAYLSEVKGEIEDYVLPRVEQCFEDLRLEIEKKKGNVQLGVLDLSVDFGPDRIYLDIAKTVKIEKNGAVQSYDGFNFEVISPLYNLASVAMDIASNEAKYCYFEYVGYMILYPRFGIERFVADDSTEFYSIEDKNTNKVLDIAIRGCAIPPGI